MEKKKIQNNGLLKADSLTKNPGNYENLVVEKNEQQPAEISLNDESPTMVYSLTHENGDGVTLKKQIVKRKILEKKLEENTEKMKRIKKKVINCKYHCFLK